MGDNVNFGGYAKVNPDDPNVKRAIASTVHVAFHPYYDQTPDKYTTESGNLVALTPEQRKIIGASLTDQIAVTDAHGVGDARGEIMVQGSNGQWYASELVKLDDKRDLAFLKIKGLAKGILPELTIAQNDNTMPGDLVYSVGHQHQQSAIQVNGGYFEGITSKANELSRLDAYFTKTQGQPYNFNAHYKELISKLKPADQADAQVDFTRQLTATKLNNQVGNSGGSLINYKGEIIGTLEAVEPDADLGKNQIDMYTPLSQLQAFANSPQVFKFTYSTQPFQIAGSNQTTQIPSLKDIQRVSGEKRLPYNATDLIENYLKP